jgi:hypothetical protein
MPMATPDRDVAAPALITLSISTYCRAKARRKTFPASFNTAQYLVKSTPFYGAK